METAQFHRAYWHASSNTGIGKIHYEPLGVIAFIFENGVPQFDTNLLDADEMSYYRQEYRKSGRTLDIGVQINRDVDLIRVSTEESNFNENIFKFEGLGLEIKTNGKLRYYLQTDGKWALIKAPFVEYKRCDSLICIS